MAYKWWESRLVFSAGTAGYADLSGELSDFSLNGEADTSSKKVMGRQVPKKEWTRRMKSIDLSGYLADIPNKVDLAFDGLEEAMIAFYHEKAGRFCIGDYVLSEVTTVEDEGLLVLNGTAEADGRVYWGHLISAAAGTHTAITNFADGWVMVHITETNGMGTLQIRFTSSGRNYEATITNAAGLYFVQPERMSDPVPEADKDGTIEARELGGIDAEYVWGYVA